MTSIEAVEKKIVKLHCNEALWIEQQDPNYRMKEGEEVLSISQLSGFPINPGTV